LVVINNGISIPLLNFKQEFHEIENCLLRSEVRINYQKMLGTLENLPDLLTQNPSVIHFSGHGVKNRKEDIGSEAILREGEGDMLVFEDYKCCGVLVSETMLK
jgi:CHAT domain-containing protein